MQLGRRHMLRVLWVLLWVACATGCSIFTEFDPALYAEKHEETCSDDIDNDGDGFVDCEDTGCAEQDHCKENSEATCTDDEDNDLDGLKNCKDPDCCLFADCYKDATCGEKTPRACTDGADNDGNGLTDCADFECATVTQCCTRLVPLVAEIFDTGLTGCKPPVCDTVSDTCCKKDDSCSVFDPKRWLSWGSPLPRIDNGKFTPNQPCDCPASGLVSVLDTTVSQGLHLEFDADLGGDPTAFLGIGLVENATITTGSCGGISTRFQMLLGVEIEAAKSDTTATVRAIVSESVRRETKGVSPKGPQRFRVEVNTEGKALFYLNDVSFHESTIPVADPHRRVRLLIQGHSGKATLDNVLLARRTGCMAHANWTSGPMGAAPVIVPSKDKDDFDSGSVNSPSVIHDGSRYWMYYSATSAGTAKNKIGLAFSLDGHNWARFALVKVKYETGQSLTDPYVIRGKQHMYLMAYRSQSASMPPVIAVATSQDGQSWQRVATAVTIGADTEWNGKDVAHPALAYFQPPTVAGKPAAKESLYLWYVGSGSEAKHLSPALGVAIGDSDFNFDAKASINPVFRAMAGGHDDRGVTDPWVLVMDARGFGGKVLHMWYAGHLWTGVGINLAASQDGIHWVRYRNNPVIQHGDPTYYGSSTIRGPSVVDRWGILHLWYGGTNPTGKPSIGYAANYIE